MGLFSKISGLDRLVQEFPVGYHSIEKEYKKCTVKIGKVRYRRCVNVGIGPEGLILKVNPPMVKAKQFFIPWTEVQETHSDSLYNLKAATLKLKSNNTPITFYEKLFSEMKCYLV
ncbi:MAG: hypothetical protein JW731_11565 [Bacteroidales bacterium]|nr:hypothetical protein [Bacteroidales bacterium]